MNFLELAEKRYSCKQYSDRPVEADKLQAVLEAGRLAPTAKNLQEQHVYVLQSDEALEKFDQLTPCRYGAKTALMVTYDKKNVFTYPGEKRDSGVEDARIIATHMILEATEQGLDSCWINFFDPDRAKELYDLPEEEEVLMLMDLGYAADGAGPLPNHSSRKDLSETVSYL